MTSFPHPHLTHWARRLFVRTTSVTVPLTLAALLTACGGGGGTAAGGDTLTASYAQGPISGFGSVIVGDTRYEDDDAEIYDDDDQRVTRDALKLGMVVEVEGSPLRPAPSGRLYSREGKAGVIRYGAVIVGPVEGVAPDATADQLLVFGQTVTVTGRTVFDRDLPGGLADIRFGDELKVHGFVKATRTDPSGSYTATRISLVDRPGPYRLRGIVTDIDPAGQTFRVGETVLDFRAVTQEMDRFRVREGSLVRLRIDRLPDAGGVYLIDRLQALRPRLRDRDEVEIEGRITRFVSIADFDVEGVPVDESRARYDDGGPEDLALGARVEVEGYLRDGVLYAREIEFEDDDDDDERSNISLEGRIESLDTINKQFELLGLLVDYSGRVEFDDGRESDLAVGVKVEVEGRVGGGGTYVIAHEIEFDD